MANATQPRRRRKRPIGRLEYERALSGLKAALHEGNETSLRAEAATVCAYEQRVGLHDASDAIEAIRIRMRQLDLRQRDLVPVLGSRSRVSEVLSGARRLTVGMIERLHGDLGIPLELLIERRPAPEVL